MFQIYQDKSDFKEEEEEKAPLGISNDIPEEAESENQSLNPEVVEQKSATEETEDTEKETGTEELIESDDKVSNKIYKYFIGRIATLSILNFCNVHNALPFFVLAIFENAKLLQDTSTSGEGPRRRKPNKE